MKFKFLLLALVLGILTYVFFNSLSFGQRGVAALTAFISIMWITEAIPLSTSALLIPIFLVLSGIMPPKSALQPLFDPVIALMFGGFVIAHAVHKYGLDDWVAHHILRIFPRTEAGLLLALILATSLLSFFMANTVTTILLIPIGLSFATSKQYAKAIVLAIAFAASIGGIGLIIGTAPNAIAVGVLENAGYSVGFLEWMFYCAPLAIILSLVCWWVIRSSFSVSNRPVNVKIRTKALDYDQKKILLIIGLMVLLWTTSILPEPLGIKGHGINSGIIALIGVVAFMSLGYTNEKDLSQIDWAILLLLGCGILLGVSWAEVGLDKLVAGLLSGVIAAYPYLAYAALVLTGGLLTIIASNTGTAALVSPIAVAVGINAGLNVKLSTVAAVAATSLDFLLPTGTPPNAIAYATRKVSIKEMFSTGGRLLIVVIPITILYFFLLDLLI